MVSRLLNIPLSTDNYNKEVNIIKQIAMANGYPTNLIDKLIGRHKNKLKSNTPSPEKTTYVSIEYGGLLHNSLKKELRKQGITMSCKTSNKLSSKFTTHQSTKNKYDSTGIYKIKCSDCSKYYVGQTGRSFKTRAAEHLPKPKLDKQRSSYAQHLIDYNHNYHGIENNLEILNKCPKSRSMDALEEYHIYKAQKTDADNVLNEKLKYSSHSIFAALLNVNKNCRRQGDQVDRADNNSEQRSSDSRRIAPARVQPASAGTRPSRRARDRNK